MSYITKTEIHPEVTVAFSGEAVGNMDTRFGSLGAVATARQRLATYIPEANDTYVMVPKSGVEYVDVDLPDERIVDNPSLAETDVHADALITGRRNVGLMLDAADCVPLVLADPKNDVLALIHLGWRGAVHRLHEDVLDYAQSAHGLELDSTVAYLGPAISKRNYTAEDLNPIQAEDPDWQPYTQKVVNGYRIDLKGFVVTTLMKRGVLNVSQSVIDTGARKSGYFSLTRHKRGELPDGRNGFVTTLTDRT